eukprot:scaffold6539_cov66-Phaeocystis_antarctica.AAC.3
MRREASSLRSSVVRGVASRCHPGLGHARSLTIEAMAEPRPMRKGVRTTSHERRLGGWSRTHSSSWKLRCSAEGGSSRSTAGFSWPGASAVTSAATRRRSGSASHRGRKSSGHGAASSWPSRRSAARPTKAARSTAIAVVAAASVVTSMMGGSTVPVARLARAIS